LIAVEVEKSDKAATGDKRGGTSEKGAKVSAIGTLKFPKPGPSYPLVTFMGCRCFAAWSSYKKDIEKKPRRGLVVGWNNQSTG